MSNNKNEKLTQFIKHAYQNAPAVKEIFTNADLKPEQIRSVDDLDKIPVTSKDRLAEMQKANPPFGGFLTVPMDTLKHIFLSPGPLYEPHAGESAVVDTINEMLHIAGFKAGDVILNTFSYQLIPTGLALDQSLSQLGTTVIPAGVGNPELQVKMMLDLAVTAYIGTPSWLMALIQKAEEMGLNFKEKFSLRKALVSAEPLPPSLRQTFVEKYGLDVANGYGTAELGFLAYNTEGGMAMRLLESSIIQVCDPETGAPVGPNETGEVVVTSFNETYPLIRLGTGDLAMLLDPNPGQSQQGERSIILVGRVGDAVKVRGMFVHPNQLRFAVSQVPSIKIYQAVVDRPGNRDELTMKVVLGEGAPNQEEVSATLAAAIQASCRIKVDKVEFVIEAEIGEKAGSILDKRIWE